MKSATLQVHDRSPQREQFRRDVLAGLRLVRKQLPCKYFYDARGSELFERICDLPEYYLTRTELGILERYAPQLASTIGDNAAIIEFGSGASTKTRILLDHLIAPAAYMPIDISRTQLLDASRQLASRYAGLRIVPICADYTDDFKLPPVAARRRVIFFPGSTIGNFEPEQARDFLSHARQLAGSDSALLIGVDLKKDPARLHTAYNDPAGVTAQFNLNILARINRELHGDFQLERFGHYAYYNPRLGRIEMHLLSLRDQRVRVDGDAICFRDGESIFTESSYKYSLAEFEQLAAEAGYTLRSAWLDEQRLFSVQYFLA